MSPIALNQESFLQLAIKFCYVKIVAKEEFFVKDL